MTLTKDDLGTALNPDGSYQCVLTPKQRDQILKNQEDAKAYNNLQLPDKDTMRDYWNRKEIVERLKKRIEERNPIEDEKCTCEECRITKELLEILGEQK